MCGAGIFPAPHIMMDGVIDEFSCLPCFCPLENSYMHQPFPAVFPAWADDRILL
jgi:hypothetical protein